MDMRYFFYNEVQNQLFLRERPEEIISQVRRALTQIIFTVASGGQRGTDLS